MDLKALAAKWLCALTTFAYYALLFLGLPFGFVVSILGVVLLHQKACDGNPENRLLCDLYGFQWWALAFEAFYFVCLGGAMLSDVIRRASFPLVGVLLFGCMQIDQAGRLTWNNASQWSRERNLATAGFTVLFVVNLLMAGYWGLATYRDCVLVQVKPTDKGRFVGLALAGVGISGVGMVAKVVADTCEVACEDDWWSLAVHLLALLFFIATEVGFKVEHFRPVLTILLSFQIRHFEISVDHTDEPLGKVGLLLTIISAYLLLFLFMPTCISLDWQLKSSSRGRGACLAVLRVLVGLIVSYVDLDFASLSPASRWIFASQIMTLIFGILSLIPGDNILGYLRLPLMAVIAMAIYESPSRIHAWVTKSESDLKITGIGNLILTVSFFNFMEIVGGPWDFYD